ncbi:hypothetical protein FQA39_LY08974 [Lamprigera yunnana]|nr:hypothetical protein FQA39_LY08974 [Lamprigera yunnana]
MVGCAAVGCTNRSESGFLMKHFPRDPQRRIEWAATMNRKNWFPTDHTVLCEVHFSPEMWEKTRQDGKRKLKHDAVPTVFNYCKFTKKPTILSEKRISTAPIILYNSTNELRTTNKPSIIKIIPPFLTPSTPSGYIEIKQAQRQLIKTINCSNYIKILPKIDTPAPNFIHAPSPEFVDCGSSPLTALPEESMLEKEKQYLQMIRMQNNTIKRRLRTCQSKVHRLQKLLVKARAKAKGSKYYKLLRNVFNEDQIYAMEKQVKLKKWSNETITKALSLKFACGDEGYRHLIGLNMPLPSLTTLCRYTACKKI